MNEDTLKKLWANFANSHKMATNWALGAALGLYELWQIIPKEEQQWLLNFIPPGHTLALLTAISIYIFRIIPQPALKAAIEQTKSEIKPVPPTVKVNE